MEFLVPHGAEIVPEGRDRAAVFGVFLRAPGIPDVGIPEIEKHGAHGDRQHAEKQNQHGVVAGDALEDLQLLVPDLALRLRAERGEPGEILQRKIPEEEYESDLAEQICRAADKLLIPDAARAHDEKRQACPETASRRGIRKYVTFHFSVHVAPPLFLGLLRTEPGKRGCCQPLWSVKATGLSARRRLLHQLIEQRLKIGGGMGFQLGAERLRRNPESAEHQLRHGVVALLAERTKREV